MPKTFTPPVLLLAAHILFSSFVFLEADQNFTLLITVQPWFPQVGGEVLLIPEESKEKVDTCSWFRWDTAEKNQILVYQPPPVKDVQYKASYTGRESVNTDCSLQIRNISISDITYYVMQRNTTKESEVGQIFLVVIEKQSDKKKRTSVSGGAVAGIFVACIVGAVFLVGLISYTVTQGNKNSQ
ncbi:carcinoembryonic antigen-related cell adhesion molecule 16-like [Podarcis lilfordi]|uniref:Carcinoembryonic antigen-related cell adhesion molecule 16-like n=1 Tax=Podarcis lilfordi TaxID=74358 RepID=A0AA35PD53_9SAUR|nr:carcinoembryonic antigen-related cell adhesion molecule 16-like [Podarcis lilfordi]